MKSLGEPLTTKTLRHKVTKQRLAAPFEKSLFVSSGLCGESFCATWMRI
jgi:hypothetical protein